MPRRSRWDWRAKRTRTVPTRWAAYLEKHNGLARFAADVADAADKAGVVWLTCWLIENVPRASRRGGCGLGLSLGTRT